MVKRNSYYHIVSEDEEFDERVEKIYKSICDSFNIEGMLLNCIEINEFKEAIRRGLE